MKHVTYISAGAGSGKTYTLTQIMADLIINREIKPEQFILTTFTDAAAGEFREKAKACMYGKTSYPGYSQIAERLDHAMIGTIHSVAYSFIQKYWYLLGISPDLKIISEEQQSFYIGQILSGIANQQEKDFYNVFAEQFGMLNADNYIDYDFWKADIKTIFEKARSYNIKDLTDSKNESLAYVDELCTNVPFDFDLNELKSYLDEIETINGGATTREKKISEYKWLFGQDKKDITLNKLKGFNRFSHDLPRQFDQIFAKSKIENNLDRIAVSKTAKDYYCEYIEKTCALAEKSIAAYEKIKQEHHLIDYTDMETLFVKLLDFPEVQSDIRETYRYVFVDEFQDSSPIQVAIFDKISNLIGRDEDDNYVVKIGKRDFYTHNSIWVGDFKQAIYGFRGADTELTKAIADTIQYNAESSADKAGFCLQSLDTSYRSVEELVQFTNSIFVPAFNNVLSKQQVELNPSKSQPAGLKSLKCWPIVAGGRGNQPKIDELANLIAYRISNGDKPSDYAVLSRNKNCLVFLAKTLNNLGIPVKRSTGINTDSDAFTLLCALLNLVLDSRDDYCRTQVAFLTEKDFHVGKIIDTRLEYNVKHQEYIQSVKNGVQNITKPEYLDENPLIKKLMANSEVYRNLTIHSLVEKLIIDLDLVNVSENLYQSEDSRQFFYAVSEATDDYENMCSELGIPPTIPGFIEYAANNAQSSGSEDGITLTTFHGSKGLEWKKVILYELDYDYEAKRIPYDVLGIQTYHKIKPSSADLYPQMLISVFPEIFGGHIQESLEDKIIQTQRYKEVCEKSESEMTRLLYVAITRAKEELIFTSLGTEPFTLLKNIGCVVNTPVDENLPPIDLFGNGYKFEIEHNLVQNNYIYANCDDCIVVLPSQQAGIYQPRDIQPSKYKAIKKMIPQLLARTDRKIILRSERAESSEIGTCIHDIFCIMETNPSEKQVKEIIKGFGFEGKIADYPSLVETWKAFESSLIDLYGAKTSTAHEVPFKFYDAETIITGSIDFIWKTSDKTVLVDFKTFPGTEEQILSEGKHYAGNYSGQFECYEKVLKAHGEKDVEKVIFYPVGGIIVGLQ